MTTCSLPSKQTGLSRTLYRDDAVSLEPLLNKRVAIIGYGNQGRPQSLNLHDTGLEMVVGLRSASANRALAQADGLTVCGIEEAVAQSDVVMLLLPDAAIASVYDTYVRPNLRPGQYLGFCHGLALLAGWIDPPESVNVFLMAPKAQGKGVRAHFLSQSGVPGLVAVHRDATGDTLDVALAYGRALGCHWAGILQTTVEEEAVTNLFAEQAVLCGGLSHLAKAAFEVLTEAGYSPEIAYFECLHEIRLLANLLHEGGITGMRRAISPTACYGDVSQGSRVIDAHVKASMQAVLERIRSGSFMTALKAEAGAGYPETKSRVEADSQHPIEQTGVVLRSVGLI
ncbi:MAG: ketol-acid reductoisomerase [Cyanobacteria bacterium HKST-UBA04]|nr:ketol-acid reductoisomerase [Cyanobacteria bacterium HKST-UBA04]